MILTWNLLYVAAYSLRMAGSFPDDWRNQLCTAPPCWSSPYWQVLLVPLQHTATSSLLKSAPTSFEINFYDSEFWQCCGNMLVLHNDQKICFIPYKWDIWSVLVTDSCFKSRHGLVAKHLHQYWQSNSQVTWLVVTKVRSKSFGLVTERCHNISMLCAD